MERYGFTFAIRSCSSNNLLHIGGPAVKQTIITAAEKSLQFYKVAQTVISSRHIKKRTIYA